MRFKPNINAMRIKRITTRSAGLSGLLFPIVAGATPAQLSAGDTAWMLTASVLVLLMTLPGLALFYAGMVRAKNALSVLMQCFAICCLASVIWALWGYSIAFGNSGMANAVWGGFEYIFMHGIAIDSLSGTIPKTVDVVFQLTFAVITPALIVGAFAERMKFSAMLWFIALWITVVYAPIAHWVWGGGFLDHIGVQDFAGGTVVHINAGVAGLVAALVLGKRKGYPKTMMRPHNMAYTLIGASLLWVGWFGFNAGSAYSAGPIAGMAMLVTQYATAAAALTWMFMEWAHHGKPSVLGICTGAVAGLVAITPASGYVGPMGALVIGIGGSFSAYYAVTVLKARAGYDDSLDAFGVHAVAGIVGALLTGIFSAQALDGTGQSVDGGIGLQFGVQIAGVAVAIAYDAIVTFILLKVLDALIGLRVSSEEETAGLDLSLHDETAYDL